MDFKVPSGSKKMFVEKAVGSNAFMLTHVAEPPILLY